MNEIMQKLKDKLLIFAQLQMDIDGKEICLTHGEILPKLARYKKNIIVFVGGHKFVPQTYTV